MVSSLLLGLDSRQYWTSAWQSLVWRDLTSGLIKPVLFGFVISTVGCYFGMSTRGGTQGVGRSTTQAVVVASVLILVVGLLCHQAADHSVGVPVDLMSAPTAAARPDRDPRETGNPAAKPSASRM